MPYEIPLLLAIELLAHHDDDTLEHMVRIGIGGSDDPPLVACVESDFFDLPRIREVPCGGRFDLPERVRNLLVFKVFEVLYPELDARTTCKELAVDDARRWIETQFLTAEAEVLVASFAQFIKPGAAIDWRVGSMFVPVRLNGSVEKDKS